MRLCAIFLILNIQLSHISASPPSSHVQTNLNQKGYECGNIFFTDSEVKEALSIALTSIDKGHEYPQLYRGKLYGESKFKEHFLYPIKKGKQFSPDIRPVSPIYHIVLTRSSNEEVDVVGKVTTGEYTRCIRKDSAHIGPSNSVPEVSDGYKCGESFFSDKTIHKSLAIAQNNVEENPIYPSPYYGSLYPEHGSVLIWPIMKSRGLYKSGTANIRPYFLVLNNERQLLDVVVRGYSNNYMRCIRSRESTKAPKSDHYSKLFVSPPRSGYFCGKLFFDDEVLRENAETAQIRVLNKLRGKFPMQYFGPPLFQECWIWPLMHDGSLYMRGNPGLYRLILTPDYSVLSVTMKIDGEYKKCDRGTKIDQKNHDMSDYHCKKRHFTSQKLVAAAEEACEILKDKSKNNYPARYEGPGFNSDPPYFTYPVFDDDKKFRFNAGLYRVVINANCDVVGAVTTVITKTRNNIPTRRLVKCHRLDDGTLPLNFFGTNAITVYEHRIRA